MACSGCEGLGKGHRVACPWGLRERQRRTVLLAPEREVSLPVLPRQRRLPRPSEPSSPALCRACLHPPSVAKPKALAAA
eukprot:363961-Chlamydomonas_euryale.AAC.5